MDFFRVVMTILLPPPGVFLQEGIGKHFWINILHSVLGHITGIAKDPVRGAPAFDNDNWPDWSDGTWSAGVHSYY